MSTLPEEERPLLPNKRRNYNGSSGENGTCTKGDFDDNADSEEEEEEAVLLLTMDDALDRLGYGPFQHRILLAAGLCFAADGMEMVLLSFLMLVLTGDDSDDNNHIRLTPPQASSITASVFAGAVVGTCVLSRLGDQWGRKPVFQWTAATIALCGMATSVAPDYHSLLIFRFGVGFGVGGLTVPFDCLAEVLPTKQRGHNLLVIEYFWTVGTMLVVMLAYLTLGRGGTQHPEGWRTFVFLCAVPCILSVLVGIAVVPESPRWLLSHHNQDNNNNRHKEHQALSILRHAAVVNGKDPDAIFPWNVRLVHDDHHRHPQELEPSGGSNISELLSPTWRRTTLWMWGTWLGMAFLYYGAIITTTMVFESSSNNPHESPDYHFDYSALFIANSAEIVGLTMVILAIDSVGRIPSQAASYFLGGVFVLALTFLSSDQQQHRTMLVILAFGARMLMMAASCTTWVSTAEILPTNLRSTGHGAANAMARLGGFVCPYIVAPSTTLTTVGWAMFGIGCWTAMCCWNLPETKGKALGHGNGTSARAIKRPNIAV